MIDSIFLFVNGLLFTWMLKVKESSGIFHWIPKAFSVGKGFRYNTQGQYTYFTLVWCFSTADRVFKSVKLLATDSSSPLLLWSYWASFFLFWHMTMHSCWMTTTTGSTVQSFVTSLGIKLWLHWLQTSKTVLFLWWEVNSVHQGHIHKLQATIQLMIFSTVYISWWYQG